MAESYNVENAAATAAADYIASTDASCLCSTGQHSAVTQRKLGQQTVQVKLHDAQPVK